MSIEYDAVGGLGRYIDDDYFDSRSDFYDYVDSLENQLKDTNFKVVSYGSAWIGETGAFVVYKDIPKTETLESLENQFNEFTKQRNIPVAGDFEIIVQLECY